MILENIRIVNFKNIHEASLIFKTGVNFIIGDNGVGKTNLLDAIYYCCMTKSYFGGSEKNSIQHEKDFYRIESIWNDQTKPMNVIVKCSREGNRKMECNGNTYQKASEHLGKIPVVMVVPNEVYTFVHVAEERRVFLNQTLVQVDTDYFSKLITYNLCQKQRMATLKWCKINERMDEELIESYEKKMLEPALYISRKRQELIQSINPLIRKYSKLISGDEQDSVLEYSTNVQSDLLQRWREEREIDIQTKRIKTGIHRDKLECKMNGQTIHNYGSQGQIKTLVMALRLAQLEYLMQHTGKKPILLLDDLFAKLDENRVMRLLELIDQMGIEQCMITDTHLDRAVKLSKILQSKSGIIIHKRNKFVGYA